MKFKRKIKRPKDARLDGTHVSLHVAMSVDPSVLRHACGHHFSVHDASIENSFQARSKTNESNPTVVQITPSKTGAVLFRKP